MNKTILWKGALAAIVLVWAIGEIVISRTNPEEKYTGTILDAQTDQILKRSCYDCHSHETVYPWYSRIPGYNLVIGLHIREAREHLNFSKWDKLSDTKKAKKWGEILEEMKEGEMPMSTYTWQHPEAVITPEHIKTIEDSIKAAGIVIPKEHHNHDHHDHDD